MEAKAVAKYIRMSPRKGRQVIDLIRGKNVAEAFAILQFATHKGAIPISKVLKSAVANAEHNYALDADNLWIKEAFVDEGPLMKRVKPRARGRADLIRRRSSHITIILGEKEGEQ